MNTFHKMTKQNRIKKTHQNKTSQQNQVNFSQTTWRDLINQPTQQQNQQFVCFY